MKLITLPDGEILTKGIRGSLTLFRRFDNLSGPVRYFILLLVDLDCSQSPIFSWDRLDMPRLTVTAILIFKCTEGAGVGNYSPRPLGSFDTNARWVARNAKLSISTILRKNRGVWTVYSRLLLLHKTQPKMTENSDCVLIILIFKWKNLKSVSNNRARVKIITHKQLKLM